QYNGYHYDYDGFGRLIKRQRPAENITQWFSYNHEHQLIEARVESLQHRSITRYQYDALGRRINKTTEHYDKYSQRYTTTGTDFSWQGMRLSGEANEQQQIRYLYNGQDYEPIARAISDRHPKTSDVHYQIEYFHTLANSLPTELTNEEGEIIWLGEYTLFGQLKHQRNRDRWYSSDKTEQNLRFAGQYYDQETGLHYNTLRYYDPNCGRFTQQDPIGLAGGINLYQYAPNTLSWIDPWGLKCSPEQLADNRINGKNAEKYIAEKLGKKSNIQVLDTQVYVKTPGLGRGRYIDILVQDLNTGKITAIEVKYNGATRSALQKAKDKAIKRGKIGENNVIFGKNAPYDIYGKTLANKGTKGINTKVIEVSPEELAEWLK
ncbi:RHS repeat-associated protein, partial [Frischella perrara]